MKKKTYLLKEDAFFVLLKCGFFLSRSGCARMGGGSLSWWMTSCPVIGGGSLSTLRLACFFISCCLGTIIDKCSYMGGDLCLNIVPLDTLNIFCTFSLNTVVLCNIN